ncbi:alpha/beta fold hydrolase [Methylomonas sp. DH-1]|uniref:alpha/beta hydrolase n=1 Tax=Methylomonas sp. (strain DH-1) TaxID=1727196 RepID=UPI0007C8B559|nr:alpha/beta fold hydrolase [Methylomonas sp. DH-1]ANE57264.1 alpha/beta hydrolase [Methylomonas sp. DH-1]
MTDTTAKTSFEFTEEMKGYLSPGQTAFQDGYDQGKTDGHYFMFHLTIQSDDLDTFLNNDRHQAAAIGWVEGDLVGGRRTVDQGVFNLFVDSADANRKQMLYRLFFTDSNGQKLTLSGAKQIQNNVGPDLWADTTTLFTNLFKGHVEADQETKAKVYATGILHIEIMDFAKQLTTIRASGDSVADRLHAVERFGGFFLGALWETYKPALTPKMGAFVREIPLYTLEGVKDAEVSTHPFTTADRLGLSLLRFQRAPSKDVVVLIPGLTAASDMFIMPEHYNLASYLLDQGFTDVWTLDGRISNRYSYNLQRHRYNVDDLALYDMPAAISTVRQAVGPDARIHVISHCFGALAFSMSLFGKAVTGIRSLIANGVSLTPCVPPPAKIKLYLGPLAADYILGVDYLNPHWRRDPGFGAGKLLAMAISAFHHECDSPECHMLSFMWGWGFPVLYKHENLHDVTHRRCGDLFGGSAVNYYRHVLKMVNAGNTAVKYLPNEPRYRSLPDNYLADAADIQTPCLLVAGQDNALFRDSNIVCHQRLEKIAPGRHELAVIPDYGHADVIMGKNAAQDVFPRFVEFLNKHRN